MTKSKFHSPGAVELYGFLNSSRAAFEHAKPRGAMYGRPPSFGSADRSTPQRPSTPPETFWALWEAMEERGGFYVRKWHWSAGRRFLVAAVEDHRDLQGQRVVLGRYCEPAGMRAARLDRDLDQPLWVLCGVTGRRKAEDTSGA